MYITLGEAARRTGLSKPTIMRAIKSGKLSAASVNYNIDPAELARVYDLKPSDGHANRSMKQDETPVTSEGLQAEVAVLRELIADRDRMGEAERRLLNERIEDLRRDREDLKSERDKLLMVIEEQARSVKLLTDQRAKPAEPDQSPAAAPIPVQQQAGLWSRLRSAVARK